MTYKVSEYIPEHVLYIEFNGDVTFGDLENSDFEVTQYIRTRRNPVYVMMDFTTATNIPFNLPEVKRRMSALRYSTYGAGIAFGTNTIISMIFNSLKNEVAKPVHRVGTIEDALITLSRDYISPEDIPPEYHDKIIIFE